MNAAKRNGYLEMTQRCGEAACNWYLRYCWARRRPYLAVSLHGNRIVVDLLPAAGVGKSANPTRYEFFVRPVLPDRDFLLFSGPCHSVDRLMAGVQQVVDSEKKTVKGGVLIANASGKTDPNAPLGSDSVRPSPHAAFSTPLVISCVCLWVG